jgi:ABC-type multidrug transport system fused ATPase/permease subunit
MEKGRIVEEGTHEVLLRSKGLYFEMYMRQVQEDRN